MTAFTLGQPPVDDALVAARSPMLALHSPYHFLRELPLAEQQARFGTGLAERFATQPQAEIIAMPAAIGQWLIEALPWDSEYFGSPTYRLFTGLFGPEVSLEQLGLAAAELRQQLAARGPYYAFGVVPAEDTRLLQALTKGGWRLIETRLNFYCPTAAGSPAPVRAARPEEAQIIGRVAAAARNDYDRFHADPWFGNARADAFLARYAEAAVAGQLADTVLVPDEPGLPVDAFLAIGDTTADASGMGVGFSRVLLTAVGSQNRGWHQKLVAAAVSRAFSLGYPYVLMTTQATNRAVFRTCEKLSFRLGSTAHVVACHST